MASGRVNGQSELVTFRMRKDVMVELRGLAGELGVPYQTLMKGYVAWAVRESKEGRGPGASELLTVLMPARGRPKKAESEGLEKGFVYFIQGVDTGLIKIGWSKNVTERLLALQMGFPEVLKLLVAYPGTLKTERQVHEKFASLRVRGEWFKPDALLLKSIEKLREVVAEKGKGLAP